MIYEYTCPVHGRFERFFKSFSSAKPYEDSVPCQVCTYNILCDIQTMCGLTSPRAVSVPLEAHLYGNPAGYHKPSPTKRHNTKLVTSGGNRTSSA